jgi:peptidoglycan/LPS O-acetylase OafA/YrhL
MIWGGESSYSLYLLHFFVLHEFGQRLLPQSTPLAVRAIGMICLMAAAIVFARASYVLFEKPALKVVRRALSPRRSKSSLTPASLHTQGTLDEKPAE